MGDETTRTIGVTGATGAIGGRVAAQLARAGFGQRLIVRDLNRAPELPGSTAAMATYGETTAFERAARGVDTLFLVSATESEHRVEDHLSAVDAALAAGVDRIVYLSFLNAGPAATFTFARDHFYTEAHIRASGVRHTFLRPSLYLDLVPHFADSDGVIRGPAGQGRVAWVSRDDVANVAVAVLTGGVEHDERSYAITGPEAVTLSETVSRLSSLSGSVVSYVPETWSEALSWRLASGVPQWQAEGWASSYAAIAAGELDTVSTTVPDLTGYPAQSIEGFMRRHPSALADIHR
ncbi:SDR family oxidoreductase [Lipingzhangella sp. LS1_29]|uniref:SDR family oxidoreductase n=1 Tax=Lipingzhangella rawalii TaxID=2055835 RepID=A0ABU2H2G4_9ACTN|nr:SDR family oxidoreductase [Lipingzhangella rawalii]MDS1269482.1 SDR family oxidoreductase [Lipingzhangella rawalii]